MELDRFTVFKLVQQEASSSLDQDYQDNFLISHKFKILHVDDYGNTIKEAGDIQVYYADLLNASNSGFDAIDVIDIESETAHFIELIDLDSDEYISEVKALYGGEIWDQNLLIISRIEIIPEYRKINLGLVAVERVIQQVGHGCNIIALKPYPLQFEVFRTEKKKKEYYDKMAIHDFEKNETKAKKKLIKYYGKIGFQPVRGTEFMTLNTLMENKAVKLKIPQV